jgi:hypothetical protein
VKNLVRALGAAALVLSTAAFAATPTNAAPGSSNNKGFSEIAGCISGADNLLVSIVVDESLSLRSTDPAALRVQGITTAIDSLEQLTASVGKSTNVEVSLSTFARSFETLSGWQSLDAQTAREFRSTAAHALPARDAGDATDYRQALLGAKRSLDNRQAQLDDPNACKLLLWFTDGALDVDAQTDTARQELCQVGGIVDAVRDDGISVVALALFTPGAGVTAPQREELRAVAEGRGAGTTCGKTPIPSDSATGVYLPADDPAALQRLFAGAGALVAGGTEIGTVTCPGANCAGGTYRLDIDQGVAGARVLVQSGTPRVSITSPSGQRLELDSGETQRVDGAEVSYLVRDQLATINVSFSPYAKSRSRWAIRPVGRSELSVYWFWGAALALETSEIKAGARNEVVVRVLDQDNTPLPASLYRGAQATMRVGDRSVKARLTPEGTIRGQVPVGVDNLPANLPVSASLQVRSIPGNVALGPVTLSERIPVTLPPSYPSVTPQELDFGHLEGIGTTTAELQLTGSRLGPTEVCFTGSTMNVPGQVAQQGLVSAATECVDLGEAESKTLPLELTPETTADGLADGEVTLSMTAADGSEDLELSVPARLEMARHVDEGTRWALIAALVALALLIPAVFLVGSNLLLARFSMTSLSRTASKPVKVTPSGLRPLSGSELLEPEDFENASFSGVQKGGRMAVDGTGVTLKARRIFSLKEPEGVATGPVGQLLVSSYMPYRGKAPGEAPVALGEVDATFVVVNPSSATADEAAGTLIMAVPGGVDRQGIRDRASRMSSTPDWRKVLAEVSEAKGSSGTTPSSSSPRQPEPSDDAEAAVATDGPPPAPWETETPSSPAASAGPPPKKSRFSRPRKDRSTASSPAPPPPAADDDTLPPLPDFLK